MSFQLLKKKVTKQPILALPYFQKPFQVKCDAKEEAIGVMFNQEDKPIGYFSEKLNEARKNTHHMTKSFML